MPIRAARQRQEFGGWEDMYRPDQLCGKRPLDVVFDIGRVRAARSLGDDVSLPNVHRQPQAAIATTPRDGDFCFNYSGPPDPRDDLAHFRVPVMRIVDRLPTPIAEKISDTALARASWGEETEPQHASPVSLRGLVDCL